jgi:two-component system nitrate/nitrite response regulator NarL
MRVAIVADIRFYREGLAELLTRHGIEVVGTADGQAGLERVLALRPELALVDTAIPDGTATLRLLTETAPQVGVVAIGVPETDGHVLACAEAGIAGYVPREGTLEDLVTTMGHVARGERLCSPGFTAGLLHRVAAVAAEQCPGALTTRELQIVALIDQGLTNQQIARRLCIQLSTVKNHVHNILEKLRVRRRADAAARVMAAGARQHAWAGLHPRGLGPVGQGGLR